MAVPARCMMERRLRLMADDGSSFRAGAALILDGSQLLDEAGADPITILGFAAEDEDPTDALGDTLAVDVHPGKTLVQIAHPGATFLMELHNVPGTQVEPAQTDIGVQYGIAPDTDGSGAWIVDRAETVAPAVTVVGIAANVENSPTFSLVEVEVIDPLLFTA